jgi:hypothetical protein
VSLGKQRALHSQKIADEQKHSLWRSWRRHRIQEGRPRADSDHPYHSSSLACASHRGAPTVRTVRIVRAQPEVQCGQRLHATQATDGSPRKCFQIVRTIEKAKAGDLMAAKLIFDRVAPALRGRTVTLNLPSLADGYAPVKGRRTGSRAGRLGRG